MASTGTFHQHLVEELRILIRNEGFAAGSQFLTERDIAERFKTSRPTANKAISSLVSAGLLEVRRGAGTFVRESVLDYDLERLVSFTDKARAAGMKPSTVLMAYRRIRGVDAPPSVVQNLGIGAADVLVYMERLRLADGKPVISERRHVVASLCPAMTRVDAKGSLYLCWTLKCGLSISGADETIHAVNAGKEQSTRLQVPAGGACFKISAVGYVDVDTPLWHEETFYRADVYEFRNRISGLTASRSALGRIKS